jgi:hypothetical protein
MIPSNEPVPGSPSKYQNNVYPTEEIFAWDMWMIIVVGNVGIMEMGLGGELGRGMRGMDRGVRGLGWVGDIRRGI